MTIVLSGNTRTQLELYMQRQAQLSGVTVSNLTKRYSVDPSVQQRLENAAKESTELTQKINVIGVDDQEGDKVLVDTTGPIARTNSSSDG
ncbi:P2 family phage major capsid protein, partial [Citrobacter freundii]